MKEVFKPITSNYSVSNKGRVFSIVSQKYLKPIINPYGYHVFCFTKQSLMPTKMLHRLIAIAFIPNPDNKPQINHKDGNKLNNSIENLEWCTARENMLHAHITGLNKNPGTIPVTEGKNVVCSNCSKEFYKRNGLLTQHHKDNNKNHYCSRKCMTEHRKQRNNGN